MCVRACLRVCMRACGILVQRHVTQCQVVRGQGRNGGAIEATLDQVKSQILSNSTNECGWTFCSNKNCHVHASEQQVIVIS